MLKNKSLMFDNWINGDLICTNGIFKTNTLIYSLYKYILESCDGSMQIVLKIYNTFDRVFSL
jgi:hypothetical protein